MSSLKMTFSLASLVLIFAMVFAPTAVMAAAGGPTVTITEYSGKDTFEMTTGDDHVQERDDFRVKVEFDVAVKDWAEEDAVVSGAASLTSALTAYTAGVAVAAGTGNDENKIWYLTIDLTNNGADIDYEHSVVTVNIAEDAVTGNVPTNQLGNVAKSQTFETLPKSTAWTVTPVLDATTYKAADNIDKLVFKADSMFTVNFRFSPGSSTMAQPMLVDAQIQVKDSKGMDVPTGGTNYVTVGPGSLNGLIHPVTLTFNGAVPHPVTIGMNPNWAAGGTIQVPAEGAPPPPDPNEVQPTVDIELIGIDDIAETFQVKFTFAKATDLDTTADPPETAADLPDELLTAIDIKITKEDADGMMVASDAYVQDTDIIMLSAGKWVATIHYEFDALPLSVTLADRTTVSAINGEMVGDLMADDPTPALMVGDAPWSS